MSQSPERFDPYWKWLGIQPKDQPPTHYRLLGIDPFESDDDVIATAADARMMHIKTFATGKSSEKAALMTSKAGGPNLPARWKQRITPPLARKNMTIWPVVEDLSSSVISKQLM